MGIMEDLEEMQKELGKAKDISDDTVDDEIIEDDPAPDESDTQDDMIDDTEDAGEEADPKPDEPKDGDPVEEEPKKDEPVADNAAMARLRREAAAEKRRADALEAKIAQQAPAPEQKPAQPEAVEPNIDEDPIGWVKWNNAQKDKEISDLRSRLQSQETQTQRTEVTARAVSELTSLEADFRTTTPDYDAVSSHMIDEVTKSVRRLNPSLSQAQVMAAVQQHVLTTAAGYAKRGLNPVEEMYHLTKEQYGYKEPEKQAEDRAPVQRPDLKKVADSRARNAGMVGAKGAGGKPSTITLEVAADMSPSEWAKLSDTQKERLMRGEAA